MASLYSLIKSATGISPVRDVMDLNGQDGIVFSLETISNDGVKREDRITIDIVTSSLSDVDDIKKDVESLITIGDKSNEMGLTVYQNGGGHLWDETLKKHHTIMYLYALNKNTERIV